jgi:hypothetical protein
MKEVPKGANVNCELFLNELETLPAVGVGSTKAELLRLKLPMEAREHLEGCTQCEVALQDFVETRRALAGMADGLPGPGPWFTRRVMNAIGEQEEERENGFWTGVRRLAPRLVAFATLVLMLGGTWAFEEQRTARRNGPLVHPVEGIFESLPSTPANDDVIASANEVAKP